MKECAHVWISVNYSTEPARTQIHPCDALPARHSSTCLFLSISPSPILSRSLYLISYWAPRLEITRSGQLFSGSKHLSGLAWDQQFHSLFQTWPSLKYILQLDSQGEKRYEKSLFSNFDDRMEDTLGAGPMEERTVYSSLFFVLWVCIFIWRAFLWILTVLSIFQSGTWKRVQYWFFMALMRMLNKLTDSFNCMWAKLQYVTEIHKSQSLCVWKDTNKSFYTFFYTSFLPCMVHVTGWRDV